MKLLTLLLVSVLLMAGCSDSLFRFAANEPQRTAADLSARLAAALAETGAAPGDPALVAIRGSTVAMAGYAGPPEKTVNIDPLLAASRDKWNIKDKQRDALEMKVKWYKAGTAMVSRQLAKLLKRYAVEGEEVDVARGMVLIHELALETFRFGNEIETPGMVKPSADVLQEILQAQREATEIAASAQALAGLRPNIEDGVEAVAKEADGIASMITSNGELISLFGGGAAVGIAGLWRSKRKQTKDDKDKLRDTERKLDLATPVPVQKV